MRIALIASSFMALIAISGCAPAAGALGGAVVGDEVADAPTTGAVAGGVLGAAVQ